MSSPSSSPQPFSSSNNIQQLSSPSPSNSQNQQLSYPHPSSSGSVESSPSLTSHDQHIPAPTIPLNTHPMVTRAKHGIFRPKVFSAASLQLPIVPDSVDAALKNAEWKEAMTSEFQALVDNQTWELVPYTDDMKVISNKWIFRVKTKADGMLDKLKARLVARGFEQYAGVDFNETFSPVVKTTTIRLVFSLAATKGWSVQQLDINNAFLNGVLEDKIYMSQPVGFIDPEHPHPQYVCKLKRSLYGLRQAPRAWYDTLTSSLLDMEFKRCFSDQSLIFKNTSTGLLLVLVYVDDILVTGDDENSILQVIDLLKSRFKLKHLGAVSYFLGIEVQKADTGFVLSQTKYLKELLHKTKMQDCHACPSPMAVNTNISKFDGAALLHSSIHRV